MYRTFLLKFRHAFLSLSNIDDSNKYKAKPIWFDAIKLLYMADVTSYISQIKVKNVINATLWTNKVILDSAPILRVAK